MRINALTPETNTQLIDTQHWWNECYWRFIDKIIQCAHVFFPIESNETTKQDEEEVEINGICVGACVCVFNLNLQIKIWTCFISRWDISLFYVYIVSELEIFSSCWIHFHSFRRKTEKWNILRRQRKWNALFQFGCMVFAVQFS